MRFSATSQDWTRRGKIWLPFAGVRAVPPRTLTQPCRNPFELFPLKYYLHVVYRRGSMRCYAWGTILVCFYINPQRLTPSSNPAKFFLSHTSTRLSRKPPENSNLHQAWGRGVSIIVNQLPDFYSASPARRSLAVAFRTAVFDNFPYVQYNLFAKSCVSNHFAFPTEKGRGRGTHIPILVPNSPG